VASLVSAETGEASYDASFYHELSESGAWDANISTARIVRCPIWRHPLPASNVAATVFDTSAEQGDYRPKYRPAAAEYRKLAQDYRSQAVTAGISIRKTTVLMNVAKSLAGLASQLELLSLITQEELSQKPTVPHLHLRP
jgi:hypothetical protein